MLHIIGHRAFQKKSLCVKNLRREVNTICSDCEQTQPLQAYRAFQPQQPKIQTPTLHFVGGVLAAAGGLAAAAAAAEAAASAAFFAAASLMKVARFSGAVKNMLSAMSTIISSASASACATSSHPLLSELRKTYYSETCATNALTTGYSTRHTDAHNCR